MPDRDWDELRRFRRFLRHAYPVELDPGRLGFNVQRLEQAVGATEPTLRAVLLSLQ